MARPTLGTHPKFARLAALVGGRGIARGALELIWDAAYASGDPNVGDSLAVEAVADWRGKRGALTLALTSSGFLDIVQEDANGSHLHGQLQTFAVHDLEDHAPDYVLKRWQREAQRKLNGQTIRSVRQQAAAIRWASRDASVRRLQTNVRPPAPAPAPSDQNGLSPARDPSTNGSVPVPPAAPVALAAPVAPKPKLWGAGDWLHKFSMAWTGKYALTYGGGAPTSKACGVFADVLETLPEAERIEAQGKAAEMFGKYLGDPSADTARHPFNWFVDRFDSLRSRPQLRPNVTRGSPPRDVRFGHVRAEDMKHTRTGEYKF
jgi:hypothetical protein